MTDPRRQLFDETVSLFVNGTATDEQKAFVEEYIKQHPEARQVLRLERLLREAILEDAAEQSHTEGLNRLLQSWERERRSSPKREASPETFFQKLSRWCDAWGLTPAFAAAASVAVVLSGVLLSPPREELSHASVYRSSAPPSPSQQLMTIRLVPTPEAALSDIIELASSIEPLFKIEVMDGGTVWLYLPDFVVGQAAAERLIDSGLFDDVIYRSSSK